MIFFFRLHIFAAVAAVIGVCVVVGCVIIIVMGLLKLYSVSRSCQSGYLSSKWMQFGQTGNM